MAINDQNLIAAFKKVEQASVQQTAAIAALAAIFVQLPGVEKIDPNLATLSARNLSGLSASDATRSTRIIKEVVSLAKSYQKELSQRS